MKVLVLGGTGSIGAAVVSTLIARHHEVSALTRSDDAANRIRGTGAMPVYGDIRSPEQWTGCLEQFDAVVHAACTWCDDMESVDSKLVAALLDALYTRDVSKALIYTGGCWFYGNTGNTVASEQSPLDPGPGFSSAIETMDTVLASATVRGMVIHPAMVYEHRGGVFGAMYEDLEKHGHVRVFGGLNIRWPLIHRNDLAKLYALMLEKAKAGDVFNAAAMDGVAVGDIASSISRREGHANDPVVYDIAQAKAEWGEWAEGYALDQQMSGQKARQELGWLPIHYDVFTDL